MLESQIKRANHYLRRDHANFGVPSEGTLNFHENVGTLDIPMMDLILWEPPSSEGKTPSFLSHTSALMAMHLLNEHPVAARHVFDTIVTPYFIYPDDDSDSRGRRTNRAYKTTVGPKTAVDVIKGYRNIFLRPEDVSGAAHLTPQNAMDLVLGTTPDAFEGLGHDAEINQRGLAVATHALIFQIAQLFGNPLIDWAAPAAQTFIEGLKFLRAQSALGFGKYNKLRHNILQSFADHREDLLPLIPSWFALNHRVQFERAAIETTDPTPLLQNILRTRLPNDPNKFVKAVCDTDFGADFDPSLFYPANALPFPADTLLKASAAEMIRAKYTIPDKSHIPTPHPDSWLNLRNSVGKKQLTAVKTASKSKPELSLQLAAPSMRHLLFPDAAIISYSTEAGKIRDIIQYAQLRDNFGGNGPTAAVVTSGLWFQFADKNTDWMITGSLEKMAAAMEQSEKPPEDETLAYRREMNDKDRLELAHTRTSLSDINGLPPHLESWVAVLTASFDNGDGTGYVKHVVDNACRLMIDKIKDGDSASLFRLLSFLSALTYAEVENHQVAEGYRAALRNGSLDVNLYGDGVGVELRNDDAFAKVSRGRSNIRLVKAMVSTDLLNQRFANRKAILLAETDRKGLTHDYNSLSHMLAWLISDVPESHPQIISQLKSLLPQSGIVGERKLYDDNLLWVLNRARKTAQNILDEPNIIHKTKTEDGVEIKNHSNPQGIITAINQTLYELAVDVVQNNISLIQARQHNDGTNSNWHLYADEDYAGKAIGLLDNESMTRYLVFLNRRLTGFSNRLNQAGGELWTNQTNKSPSRQVADALLAIATRTRENLDERIGFDMSNAQPDVQNLNAVIITMSEKLRQLDIEREKNHQPTISITNGHDSSASHPPTP